MFGSKRVQVAGRGDLHGETGKKVGTATVAGTKYARVLLDGEGHDRLLPPGNLTRGKKKGR